jgi:hypothetical protein
MPDNLHILDTMKTSRPNEVAFGKMQHGISFGTFEKQADGTFSMTESEEKYFETLSVQCMLEVT